MQSCKLLWLSKHVCENIIQKQLDNKKIHYAILRYFNVVGTIVEFKIEKKIHSLLDIIGNSIKRNKYEVNMGNIITFINDFESSSVERFKELF